MPKLFGTNGIRGVFGQDFNLEFIHDITLCFAEYFKKGPILVGYDGRDTSPIIAKMQDLIQHHVLNMEQKNLDMQEE